MEKVKDARTDVIRKKLAIDFIMFIADSVVSELEDDLKCYRMRGDAYCIVAGLLSHDDIVDDIFYEVLVQKDICKALDLQYVNKQFIFDTIEDIITKWGY